MSEYKDIRFEVNDGVAVIELHRPEHLNTYSGLMGEELGRAYRICDEDDGIRAVVLTGAGKAFCAGADMSAGEDTFAKQDETTFSAAGVDPPAWEIRKPVIAAMNGHAIGIGLTLALQCDMRIIANEGNTGCSTGPHTHFGFSIGKDNWVDPCSYLPYKQMLNGFSCGSGNTGEIGYPYGGSIYWGRGYTYYHKGIDIIGGSSKYVTAAHDGYFFEETYTCSSSWCFCLLLNFFISLTNFSFLLPLHCKRLE